MLPNRFLMLTAEPEKDNLMTTKTSALQSTKEIFPPYICPDESSVPKISTNFIGSVQSFVNEFDISEAQPEFKLNVVLEDRVTQVKLKQWDRHFLG